jgi:hypothetical protein
MQSTCVKLVRYILILGLSLFLFGCSPSRPTVDPNLIWAVSLSQFEVKDKLEIIESVNQYGQTVDQLHQQFPDEGDVFLIMKLTVNKQGEDPAAFDWSQLTVQDELGNPHQRYSNDTFLEQYKYSPRMTNLEIKFGENTGWVCYEIPAQAAQGKLSLIYSAEGSQQVIVIKN